MEWKFKVPMPLEPKCLKEANSNECQSQYWGWGGEKMLKNETEHEILELIAFVNSDSAGESVQMQSHQTLHKVGA